MTREQAEKYYENKKDNEIPKIPKHPKTYWFILKHNRLNVEISQLDNIIKSNYDKQTIRTAKKMRKQKLKELNNKLFRKSYEEQVIERKMEEQLIGAIVK